MAEDISLPTTRAFVLHPSLRGESKAAPALPEARLEEAKGLARAIHLEIAGEGIVYLSKVTPSTYIGRGKAEELRLVLEEERIPLLIVDASLSPAQQRNLERALSVKVIDRTALVLEIFGERARTKEGTLQVELAHLTYQRSRLVRSWTHLERQRGGRGFLGGPGETQIEMDRRIIDEKIVRLKKELEDVKRTRSLHRKERSRVPYPVVALVGYTNAGKSTLFNRLTNAAVYADNLLFATLDPTMRSLKLPSNRSVILSDTVGFISDLPTELVISFHATLEEVEGADVLVHVRDASHPFSAEQKKDVEDVLKRLHVNILNNPKYIEVLNKIDALSETDRLALSDRAFRSERTIPVSALTGEGVDRLLSEIDRALSKDSLEMWFTVRMEDGATAALLHRRTEVLEKKETDSQEIIFKVKLSKEEAERLSHLNPSKTEP